jgi:hypothetical protein
VNESERERPGVVQRLRGHWLLGEAFKAWFALTEREQAAAVLLTALFLLGIVVRYWRVLL